jgi:hypothetical protein
LDAVFSDFLEELRGIRGSSAGALMFFVVRADE